MAWLFGLAQNSYRSAGGPGRFLLLLIYAALSYKLIDFLADLHSPPNYITVPCEKDDDDNNRCPSCAILQMNPFDTRIQHLLQKPPDWDCESRYRLLFKSTWDSRIVPDKGLIRKEGYVSCCYRTLKGRLAENDLGVSSVCYNISTTTATKIPAAHEFIGIYCKNGSESSSRVPVDAHAFVWEPKGGKGKIGNGSEGEEGNGKWNVVVFGMDAMSRMNFHRNMPRSYAFLMGEMGAVEMGGFNKIDANTVLNLIPFLSSKTASEHDGCVPGCPYIWRKYAEQNYSTAFIEDSFDHPLASYLIPGLRSYPPHHHLRPAADWASTHINHTQVYDRNYACFGPRLTFQFLLDHVEKYVERMSRSHKSFFHFTWAGTLTHNHQAGALVGDPHLLKTLKWLKSSGYLDKTILILMGDHGNRLESFHGSPQGQLEDRLPGLFLVFPDSFKRSYGRAYRNLERNWDKLVTVLDLHQTLLDILDLESIREPALESREQWMTFFTLLPRPRGQSLFLPIPGSRTCDMAGIDMKYCTCNFKFTKPVPLPLDNLFLADMANMAISRINSKLKGHFQCAQLQLQKVTLAQETGPKEVGIGKKGYTIIFDTKPGGGQFQAWIDWRNGNNRGSLSLQDNIERSNQYGPTSGCAKDEKEIRPYCYCLDDKTSVPAASTTPPSAKMPSALL